MSILELLLNPKVLSILGPVGLWAILASFALYKLGKRYDDIQETRIKETKEMQKEYYELANDIEKTLNTLLAVIGKRNGNSEGTK
jgi:hypothetical protein